MDTQPRTPSTTHSRLQLGPGFLCSTTPGTPSSESPDVVKRCLCGRELESRDDMYCSTTCAREDALSSLCYNSLPSSTRSSSLSLPPSNHPSTLHPPFSSSFRDAFSDTSSASASLSEDDSSQGDIQWSASHYRRVAHEEMRREERREERRRRRAERMESSVGSVDLGSGGDGRRKHNRNSSTTSTFSSLASSSSRTPSMISTASSYTTASGFLSRSGSTTSNASASSRKGGKGSKPPVFAGIAESEEEEEEDGMEIIAECGGGGLRKGLSLRTVDVFSSAYSKQNTSHSEIVHPRPVHHPRTVQRDRQRSNALGMVLEQRPGGGEFMGKEMKDALDEILDMESGFTIDTEDESDLPPSSTIPSVPRALNRPGSRSQMRLATTPSSERLKLLAGGPMRYSPIGPPKTPPTSAAVKRKRSSMIPPNAPLRTGHSFNDLTAPATPSFPAPYARRTSRYGGGQSMSGMMGNGRVGMHAPTRSEPFGPLGAAPVIEEMDPHSPSSSYNALPAQRLSGTPVRRSLTFDPASGPPLIPGLTLSGSPPPFLPSYERSETPTNDVLMQNLTPHGPSVPSGRNDILRLSQPPFPRLSRNRTDSGDSVLRFQFPRPSGGSQDTTPVKAAFGRSTPSPTDSCTPTQSNGPTGPLGFPARRLQPSLFPASPYTNGTPPFLNAGQHHSLHAPTSGLMLGVLLGSGDDDDDDDPRGEAMDVDEVVSPVTGPNVGDGFLPVFLEAEGFDYHQL